MLTQTHTPKNEFFHSNDYTELLPQTFVKLKMDYKLILESQYITDKMAELSPRPMEVGFLYGGKVETTKNEFDSHTTITLEEMITPTKQHVTQGTFDFEINAARECDQAFAKKGRRIVGQGHSHNTMPVFHSSRDRENYRTITSYIGFDIDPFISSYVACSESTHTNYSPRTKKETSVTKSTYEPKKVERHCALPTLIFNTHGNIAQGLAVTDLKDHWVLEDIPIEYYNKQAVLTIDDKRRLDRKCHEILAHNNMQVQKSKKRKPKDYLSPVLC